ACDASAWTGTGNIVSATRGNAPPYEGTTSERRSPARASTGSGSAASSFSRAPPGGGGGLLPAPYESAVSTRNRGASNSTSERHWLALLAFACRQTTAGPAPVSRKDAEGCVISYAATRCGSGPRRGCGTRGTALTS